jgi:hypothetical protein
MNIAHERWCVRLLRLDGWLPAACVALRPHALFLPWRERPPSLGFAFLACASASAGFNMQAKREREMTSHQSFPLRRLCSLKTPYLVALRFAHSVLEAGVGVLVIKHRHELR